MRSVLIVFLFLVHDDAFGKIEWFFASDDNEEAVQGAYKLEKKTKGLTTPRSSKHGFPNSFDSIGSVIDLRSR
jgi:hypothetical protein